uniref:Uncharacterized protein n=1 Tax=Sphaerodactylus townsendi TaxID=933632 RepID=A0ACB8FE76_9SAUR
MGLSTIHGDTKELEKFLEQLSGGPAARPNTVKYRAWYAGRAAGPWHLEDHPVIQELTEEDEELLGCHLPYPFQRPRANRAAQKRRPTMGRKARWKWTEECWNFNSPEFVPEGEENGQKSGKAADRQQYPTRSHSP